MKGEVLAQFTDNGYRVEISGNTAKVSRQWEDASGKGVLTYYVSCHMIETSTGRAIIWICSCPDFHTGRPGRGINPIGRPCKHVKMVQRSEYKGVLLILPPQKDEVYEA